MKRDYREATVNGFIVDAKSMRADRCKVDVRMTSDKRGQSLSLCAFNIMIEISLEGLEKIIKVVEK